MDNKKICDWVIDKIKAEYQEDVALLIGHGFDAMDEVAPEDTLRNVKGEFDYFIPETDRAYEISQSFIVNGVGYDLYPRSWNSIAAMADLNDCHTSCLADANILYAKSEKEVKRFEEARKKLLENLNNAGFSYGKAMERLNISMDIYQTMIFSDKLHEIRASAGYIIDYLAQAVAFVNGKYFKRGPLYQLEEMRSFSEIPPFFTEDYREIIHAVSAVDIKHLCKNIIKHTRDFLLKHDTTTAAVHKADFRGLADWYQELGHSWPKLYDACARKDITRTFVWGCTLQHELDIIQEEFELEEMSLMNAYDAKNLQKLSKRAEELERYIIETIAKNSVNIAIYQNVEDFLAKN